MEELFRKIAEHLQSLGYETDTEKGVIKASHPQYADFWVLPVADGAFLRTIFEKGPLAETDQLGYLRFLLEANRQAVVARFSDWENLLVIEAWFPHPFEQESFRRFLEQYLHDLAGPVRNNRAAVERFFPA